MNKKFLKFKYAAIRRYGEKQWTANADVIEFNPNYTVGVSGCEKGEVANSYVDAECYDKVKKNISKLNSSRYGSY